jgi:hypothetical protein
VSPGKADFARSGLQAANFSDAVAPDGNIYVCGGTWAYGAGSSDALLQKWTPQGELEQDDWGQKAMSISMRCSCLATRSSPAARSTWM